MIVTQLTIVGLAALLAGPAVAWWQGAPWPYVLGPVLAAGAPLIFVALRLRSPARLDHHPLVVSILSGLGCVIAMTGVQRFGTAHAWTLYAAAASLAVWMLWQRQARRRHSPRS